MSALDVGLVAGQEVPAVGGVRAAVALQVRLLLCGGVSGVSFGSKLTLTISKSCPGSSDTPSALLARPFRIWVQSMGQR